MTYFETRRPDIDITMRKFSQAIRSLDPPQQFPARGLFQLDGLGKKPYREKDACVEPPNAPSGSRPH